MVEKASGNQLQEYKIHSHNTIALHAAWEEVKRSACVCRGSRYEKDEYARIKFDRRALQRFLGIVEGRLRVTPPEWWQAIMARVKTYPDDQEHLSLYPIINKHEPYWGEPGSIQALVELDVTRLADGTVKVELGKFSCMIPARFLEAAKREYNWEIDSAKLLNLYKNLTD